MRSALPAWFYSLIRRETVGFEPYTAHPRWSLQILRARPVGPSELRARARAIAGALRAAGIAHLCVAPSGPSSRPFGPKGFPSGKKYPLWALRAQNRPVFRRKNTPYGDFWAEFPRILGPKCHQIMDYPSIWENSERLQVIKNLSICHKNTQFITKSAQKG